jgi:coenzyme F420-reducing hydrogenase delta subunit
MIEQPCSGRVDVRLLLEAFEQGADGVYVAGCLEGDCHFLKGNYRAKLRVGQAKEILNQVGIGGDRLEMFNLSGSMGPRFAEIAQEMTERISTLGPSPINLIRAKVSAKVSAKASAQEPVSIAQPLQAVGK